MPEPQLFRTPHTKSCGLFLCFLRFAALLGCITVCASGVTLEWNPNPESNIAGYKVHYGTQSQQLTEVHDAGQTTSCVLNELAPETTYYFAVQAYNTAGLHSGLSGQVTFTTRREDSGVVSNAAGEPMPVLGGEIHLGFVNLGAICEARTFTFTNTGTVRLTNFSFTLAGVAPGDFKIVGNSSQGTLLASSLEPGESVTFGIAFCPNAAGYRDAVLSLTSSQSRTALFEATLCGNGSVLFEPWLDIKGASGDTDGNPDGDALNNLFEYAFGTDPMAAQGTTATSGANGLLVSRGAPGVRVLTTPAFEFRGVFARRKDHAKVGLIYRSQFSADLNVWVDSTATPVVDGADGEIEAVSVSAPAAINGLVPRFFRVTVMRKGKLSLPAWLAAHEAGGGSNGNPDGDALDNIFEFAFGTDPAVAQSKIAAEENGLLVSRGAPAVRFQGSHGSPDFGFSGVFCRRMDHAFHGLIYKPQFSADLKTWVDATEAPQVRANDGEIEVVSVSAPESPDGKTLRFFRIGLSRKSPPPTEETAQAMEAATDDPNGNPDGDGLNNLLEFAFGTKPQAAQFTMIGEDKGLLVSRGAPTARVTAAPAFGFQGLFGRRMDRASHGLIYKPQFSADLISWMDADETQTALADDGVIEVVTVQAPALIDGRKPRFFRVAVNKVP